MSRKRTSVAQLAREAEIDLDEALVLLWDAGFDQVNGPGDLLQRGEANRARRALGLATRRELASGEYWQEVLGINPAELQELLAELGVKNPFDGLRLRKKALNRLRAEANRRGRRTAADVPAPSALELSITEPLIWHSVGHERDLQYLTINEVEAIHAALVADFADSPDPISPSGVKSRDLLASAVFRPLTSNGALSKYPTIEMAGAALLHGVVHDHPFHNGNKRTALVAMLVFLDENGLALTCEEDRLFKLVLQLAQHALVEGPRGELADRETLAVANWLASCSRWLEHGDRALQWRKLRRILANFDCKFEFPQGVGNRINISRSINRRAKGIFGRARTIVLRTQSYYGDEGREIDKSAINKIRHDLELDDDHGIDSRSFYESDAMSPSDFIIRYRKTLGRLAKL